MKYFNILPMILFMFISCDFTEQQAELKKDSKLVEYKLKDLFKEYKLKGYEPVYPTYRLVLDRQYRGQAECVPPAMDCLTEIVAGDEEIKTTEKERTRKELYNTFRQHYKDKRESVFFENENWRELFTGLTDYCADELANENLRLLMNESSSESGAAEIYLIVNGGTETADINDSSVIGAVQIKQN